MFNSFFNLKESTSYGLVNNLCHLKGRFLTEAKKPNHLTPTNQTKQLFFFPYTAVVSLCGNCLNSHNKVSAANPDFTFKGISELRFEDV